MDTRDLPTECWLTPRAEVRGSPIQGRGLFATAPIAEGEVVARFGGPLIDDAELAATSPPSSFTVAPGLHMVTDPEHPASLGNHACDPNVWHRDAVTLQARRPIAEGEELTSDYATMTGVESWSMECRCGTALCRGRVTGADWRLASLRAAYGRRWTPALLARIDSDGQGPHSADPASGTVSDVPPSGTVTGSP
ncbi:SET domain-containing protein [Streptomyces sp. PT12]|uniref:SET domain-containing protein n=1 Tax=Streptomyces sp. PT12 TaxID=1510197 RepID=UPI000DE355A2|nr:SET domain-containing protein-lysine N-methyltransferase [Streptomyces sp. PT12]RBM07264.1 SET domain-containing protein-lysine N-methyltransferase [Streptomyces sp. PT12]